MQNLLSQLRIMHKKFYSICYFKKKINNFIFTYSKMAIICTKVDAVGRFEIGFQVHLVKFSNIFKNCCETFKKKNKNIISRESKKKKKFQKYFLL